MSKKANPAIIGGFVIGAIILTVVALLAFAGGRLFADTDTLVTYFEGSLRGLRVGANVTFRGVKIGEVTDVSVTTDARTLDLSIPAIITILPTIPVQFSANFCSIPFQKAAVSAFLTSSSNFFLSTGLYLLPLLIILLKNYI